ncbi:MAG: cytochrome c biogenesis protein CcdA [Bacteroidota bacterium]|nr:cytochrome c biogenesis protein CcdA [Bacteroidota bacterium]
MRYILSLVFVVTTLFAFSQIDAENNVKWEFSIQKTSSENVDLIFEATLNSRWRIYSQKSDPHGPDPTYIEFTDGTELIGEIVETGELIRKIEPLFDNVECLSYYNNVVFKQTIHPDKRYVNAIVGYIACNDTMCKAPEELEIVFDLEKNIAELKDLQNLVSATNDIVPELTNLNLDNPISDCGNSSFEKNKNNKSIWLLFFLGFLGGLVAIFTPCVFPMIPLTVSFFTKDNTTKGGGVFNAVLYGIFILFIYASLSIPFHFGSDPAMLNKLSTSWVLNVLFFLIFMFFAFSFFGYYDLKLPSKWANKSDTASSKTGIIGIFFMALTLAIVSFSCTGPILGSVLAGVLTDGPWPITAAMIGFGFSLGIPFAIFAMFPNLLSKLPQSGGWLNSIKVILGFIEIALAFKFLSKADLVEHWGILKIEAFLISWILVGLGLTLYILGKIKFPHDSPVKRISLSRGVLAVIFFSFTIYLISGFKFNEKTNSFTSLNILSGIAPPVGYSWLYPTECPSGLNCYHTFNAGQEIAQRENKPILLDFTGHGCENCRRMEERVWSDSKIHEIIDKNYILISLYVDDRMLLPEEEQGVVEINYSDGSVKHKRIKTIGDKWAVFEMLRFKQQGQPYYFLLTPDGKLLNNPVAYTPDKDEYKNWLQCGLDAFNGLNN